MPKGYKKKREKEDWEVKLFTSKSSISYKSVKFILMTKSAIFHLHLKSELLYLDKKINTIDSGEHEFL